MATNNVLHMVVNLVVRKKANLWIGEQRKMSSLSARFYMKADCFGDKLTDRFTMLGSMLGAMLVQSENGSDNINNQMCINLIRNMRLDDLV